MRTYIRKEGNEPVTSYVNHGPDGIPAFPEYTPTLPQAERKSWAQCLADSTDQESFLAALREHHTKEYILQYFNIRAFAQEHFNRAFEYESPYESESWNVPEPINDWITEVLGEVSTVTGTYFFFL